MMVGLAAGAAAGLAGRAVEADARQAPPGDEAGAQRLTRDQLASWEALAYGMFIHFGMSTYDGDELSSGRSPVSLYAPDRLDVGQWISVARDAGMKYAVLTTKHVAGHCLWPTKHTDYSVAQSGNKTDVCGAFVRACEARGVRPGFYYCSWDNHNRFGSRTPSDDKDNWGNWAGVPSAAHPRLAPYTTSVYQNFQTLQVTELLTQYGPIAEVWIDIPGVLGPGYRDFLYRRIASLQPQTVIMMNNGLGDGDAYDADYAWPSDLIAIERALPPGQGHQKWREIAGRRYYVPGEVCDPIGRHWFFVEGDAPRPDAELAGMFQTARSRGVNLLLDVPPDRHGLIPEPAVGALMRLRKNVGI
jgi:alpha-L-fucosidase